MEILTEGEKNRHYGATEMNNKSSRSHGIFKLSVEKILENGEIIRSELAFVDLAGSERVSNLVDI